MNIVVFYHDDVRKISGTPLYILKIARELAKKHKIHLVFKHKKIDVSKEKGFQELIPNKNIITYNLFSSDFSLLSPLFFAKFSRLVKKIKPDFIYSYSHLWALPSLRLARKNKIPIIYEAHGLWYEHCKPKMPWIKLFIPLLIPFDKCIMAKFDGLNAVSPNVKEFYKKNKNCLVTFPCVELDVINKIKKKEVKKDDSRILVTYSGNFNPYQGLDLLLGAMKVLKQRNLLNKFLFQCIGNTDDSLLTLAKKEGVVESIKLCGKKKPSELDSFYAKTDIFVVPRRDSANVKYSCAGKLLEYMAMGKCVVSTNVGGAPALIKSGVDGFLVNPNEEELADALIALQDKKVREKVGKNASKKISENYTIVHAGKNIEELFKRTTTLKK
tara:strand:+ start:16429 stop:17580 length:1152 start_codon:yes stop_codon:yes gene_type:complete